MSTSTYKLNTIPSLTWNWMKMNRDVVELENTIAEVLPEIKAVPEGIKITTDASVISTELASGIFNFENPKLDAEDHAPVPVERQEVKEEPKVHPLEELLNKTCSKAQKIEITGKVEQPLVINFTAKADSSNLAASVQKIIAKENSEATVVFVYESSADLVKTEVIVEDYAKLHIIKVQLLPETSFQADDTQIVCKDNAKAIFTQIELGGNHVDSGLHVKLNGFQSTFEAHVAYLCQKEQFLDINHIVDHYGKKTECKMNVNGTLKDNSVKTYRGTIDFKNGCAGSKGNEMEETLLLSPKVVNKSIPVILCDEEDVEGEHGATIGRLSSDILFYMESRGIDEKSAEEIMSRAKIQAFADLIPDEETKQKITDYLDKNF